MAVSLWICPYGTHIGPIIIGVPIRGSQYTSHTGPIWACYLGPTWVHYGRAHMSLSVWNPYTYKPVYITHGAHMGLLSVESLLSHRPIHHINYMVYRSVYIHRVFPLIDE